MFMPAAQQSKLKRSKTVKDEEKKVYFSSSTYSRPPLQKPLLYRENESLKIRVSLRCDADQYNKHTHVILTDM